MARVLIVDDSPSVRALLASRLRAQGHTVDEAVDGESGAERAIASTPDVVVTDLVMTGISGVQLCRLLRSEPATAHLPVVLLTASGDKRSRFWARSAGAAAYVGKDRLDELVARLPGLVASHPRQAALVGAEREGSRRSLHERISSILDAALFESVIAGEVRALTSNASDLGKLFEGLATLLSDVLSYRWLAIAPASPTAPLLIHAHPSDVEAAEAAARGLFAASAERAVQPLADDRAVPGERGVPEAAAITFGGDIVGRLGIAPTFRGLAPEEKRMLALVASELGGPLQMASLYEDARRLATTDTLTGLLNRRALIDAVDRERARSDRHAFPLALLLLDVDHFKRVNDVRGHAAGDAVLQGVAKVLAGVARRSDIVARWGGEEFLVALPQTSEAGARVAAERLRRAIAEASFPAPTGEPLRVTASIGLASADAPWKVDSLIEAADAAMYSAKSRGRNRVECSIIVENTAIRRLRATHALKDP